jgi:sigma-B regulation protein RsbU (phosphoserine phosphatase)
MKLVDLAANAELFALSELMLSIAHAEDPCDLLQGLFTTATINGRGRAYAQVTPLDEPAGHFAVRRLCAEDGRLLAELSAGPRCGGAIGQLIGTPLPKIVHELDLNGDAVLPASMLPYQSAMAAPVFVNQSVLDWAILFDPRPDAFTTAELSDMLLRTHLAGMAIASLQVERRLFDANLRIQREISDIAAIQRALLPQSLPQIPGVQIAASYETATQAGGDIYDLVPIGVGGRTRWAIFIGDVVGHGPAAAVVMTMLHCLLHACPPEASSPARILAHLNAHICAKGMRAGTFATAFLALYDPATRKLAYASAGHNAPILASPGAATPIELDDAGSAALGLTPDVQYSEAEIALSPGQLLLLYTDGITEAQSPGGGFFGTEGIIAAMGDAPADAEAVVRRIKEAVLTYAATADPADDQTLVALRFL